MRPLILWDIDGTLLSTGGAGRGALDEAFESLHGVKSAFTRVVFGGATDPGIVAQAFEHAGLEHDGAAIDAVLKSYLPLLRQRLRGDSIVVHPGVPAILDETEALGLNALLTGNWSAGARHKLEAVGIWERFAFGAFGDDSAVRNDLVRVARERCPFEPEQVVVVGDTPSDVACARAGEAIAVAVCTGWSSREELEAAAPDLLLEDLCEGREALLGLLRGLR